LFFAVIFRSFVGTAICTAAHFTGEEINVEIKKVLIKILSLAKADAKS